MFPKGLILTSPRSVTAIKLAESPSLDSWRKLPTFCIGQSTETIARNQLGLEQISGTDSGNSKNLANYILSNLEKVDDESRRNSVLDTLCSAEDVINLPEHPNPPGLTTGDLKVNLLKHQVCSGSPILMIQY